MKLKVLFNTLLLLCGAEGAARIAEWIHPPADDLTFEYAPYRMLKMSHAPWHLNRDGFRARELETYRNAFLIEFLGGSVCLGVGTNPGPTIPERLEIALHRAGLARAEVLNLCQGGATSAQELAIFLEYGLPLAPQVVLSFDGANDVMHPQPIGEDTAPNLPYHDREMRTRMNGDDALGHLALARVASRLAIRWSRPSPVKGGGVPESAILNSYISALSATRTLTEAQGGFYALLLQPTLHYEKPWSAEESAMWRERRPADAEGFSRLIRDRYGAAREAVASWTPFYDLTPVFAHIGATIYSDSVHFNGPQGYAMLFDELERQGLVKQIAALYRVGRVLPDPLFEPARRPAADQEVRPTWLQ
jgi:hypothetical protein